MRLVVIDTKALTYRVYEGRKCIVEFVSTTGEPAWADQVEEMRLVEVEPTSV